MGEWTTEASTLSATGKVYRELGKDKKNAFCSGYNVLTLFRNLQRGF